MLHVLYDVSERDEARGADRRPLKDLGSTHCVASIMGWSPSMTAKMAKRYGHIGSEVQRAALDALATAPLPAKTERSDSQARHRARRSPTRDGWVQNRAHQNACSEQCGSKLLI